MRDEFYVVLPSNSSMGFHPENTTTRFTTMMPRPVELDGSWCVAMTEIQIPLTFPHFPDEKTQVLVRLTIDDPKKDFNGESDMHELRDSISPGVYSNVTNLIDELNKLDNISKHIVFEEQGGNYVGIKRICSNQCVDRKHTLHISTRFASMLGFTGDGTLEITEKTLGTYPASLSNSLPKVLMVYCDILEPYITGDVYSRLLRAVPIDHGVNYRYGNLQHAVFFQPMYLPLLYTEFQTVEIDIRDQYGDAIPFDFGTLTVTLHFKRSTI